MKVLFQKPRCATATFKVSAPAVCAAAMADRPTSKASVFLMAFSLRNRRPMANFLPSFRIAFLA